MRQGAATWLIYTPLVLGVWAAVGSVVPAAADPEIVGYVDPFGGAGDLNGDLDPFAEVVVATLFTMLSWRGILAGLV